MGTILHNWYILNYIIQLVNYKLKPLISQAYHFYHFYSIGITCGQCKKMNSFPQTMKQIFILVLEFHLRTNDFIKNDNFFEELIINYGNSKKIKNTLS